MFLFLLFLGLFLPGFFIEKYLRNPLCWASAFVISLLVLFHSVFWLGVFDIPIRLWTALPCMIGVSAAAAWLWRRGRSPVKANPSPQFAMPDRILLLFSGLVGVVLFARSAISSLIGSDTLWRWDFLAKQLLALGKFDFYPPLTATHFRTYFFVDGIPPLVSFTHWWLYATAGRHLPSLVSILVVVQFVCTLAFTYGAAAAVFSQRAGVLAMAILAASPLFFRSVVVGQETGLTALGIAATIYFIVSARQPDDVRAMVSAGLGAALCALSREYGWIAVIAGVIALLWRRQKLWHVLVFAGVAAACAAPWYLRNWILAGNPMYGLRVGSFAVNQVHDGIFQYYNELFGAQHFTAGKWLGLLGFFCLYATFQVFVGIPGALVHFRQHGYLAVIALLLTAVWLLAVGYTSGGVQFSNRVLSPAMVVLSISGAGLLEPLTRRPRWHVAIAGAIVLCQIWTAGHGVLYPGSPHTVSPGQWLQGAFLRAPEPTEFQVSDQLAKMLPPGSRLLSDNAVLFAAMTDRGIEVVPVWSPEVAFLFSSSPEQSERQLRSLGIGSVAYYPESVNTLFLTSMSPFFASLLQRWHVQAEVPHQLIILVP